MGCVTGPLIDNPMRLPGAGTHLAADGDVPASQVCTSGADYAELFEQALDAVDDFFPIAYASRYDGRILGKPTLAPGYEQFWKPGSPDKYQRLLVTAQAYRYRCELKIREADARGYFVEVVVRKELKDYASPLNQFTAISVFGDQGSVDRDRFLVVDPDATSPIENPSERWIPKGRETAIEQAILRKLQRCP
jgi:hypothetical protein